MEPSPLFVYDPAGISAHYAAARNARRRRPGVKALDLEREARQRWEEEGGSSFVTKYVGPRA